VTGLAPTTGVTRLILWRHGQTTWNAIHRVQGQLDAELSELGIAQAAEAAPRLLARRPDVLVASDLSRAADTIAPLAALTGLPVTYDQRLRERHYGQWQGLQMAEIAQRWPEAHARWRAGEPVPELGLEGVDDLGKRTAEALAEIAQAAPGSTIVVATHGGAARHGASALLGWPESAARTLGPLRNCHHTELMLDSVRGWQLMGHNVP
jgi:glucosyl-3-phosphoglycerate phosphatase